MALQPRQRDLTYWLSDEDARRTPAGVTTALRSMAWNRGQIRGMACAALGAGISFTGLGILASATGGGPGLLTGLLTGLSVPGLALALFGALMFRRVRRQRVPRIAEVAPSRGPGNVRSGLWTLAFFTVVLGLASYPLSARLLEGGLQGGALLLGYAILVLAFFGSIFAVPSYFIEHAERDFRADIAASPELRTALEEMSATWRDPVGTREFGPL